MCEHFHEDLSQITAKCTRYGNWSIILQRLIAKSINELIKQDYHHNLQKPTKLSNMKGEELAK